MATHSNVAISTATDQKTCVLASCVEGFAWYVGYMVQEEVAFLNRKDGGRQGK